VKFKDVSKKNYSDIAKIGLSARILKLIFDYDLPIRYFLVAF